MAAADIAKMDFGYVVGGTGTDDTNVIADRLWVKGLAFAGSADAATCEVTAAPVTTAGARQSVWRAKTLAAVNAVNNAGSATSIFFGDKGIPIKDMNVKLANAGDRLYIYLKF